MIFAKGGYVSFPVVLAGRILNKKIIIHESDSIPGLATKICALFANKICLAYPEAKKYFPKKKAILTGNPIREEILKGNLQKGLQKTGFNTKKPIVLIMGGSSGAAKINELAWKSFRNLLAKCQIIHICGEGKKNIKLAKKQQTSYKIFEYLEKDLPDIYATSDLIISRAGANSVSEIQALGRSSILIPLSKRASRGEQIKNAQILEKKGGCVVLREEKLTPEKFSKTIIKLLQDKKKMEKMGQKAGENFIKDGANKIIEVLTWTR